MRRTAMAKYQGPKVHSSPLFFETVDVPPDAGMTGKRTKRHEWWVEWRTAQRIIEGTHALEGFDVIEATFYESDPGKQELPRIRRFEFLGVIDDMTTEGWLAWKEFTRKLDEPETYPERDMYPDWVVLRPLEVEVARQQGLQHLVAQTHGGVLCVLAPEKVAIVITTILTCKEG